MKTAYDIVTPPSPSRAGSSLNQEVRLETTKDANKIEIKKAVEEIFGVTVTKVTTTNVHQQGKAYLCRLPMGQNCLLEKGCRSFSVDQEH